MNNDFNLIQTYIFTLDSMEHTSYKKLSDFIKCDEFKIEHFSCMFQAIVDKNSPDDVPGPITDNDATIFYPLLKEAINKFSPDELKELNSYEILYNALELENKDFVDLFAQKGLFRSTNTLLMTIFHSEKYHLSLINYCDKNLLKSIIDIQSVVVDKMRGVSYYEERCQKFDKFLDLFNLIKMKDSLEDELNMSTQLVKKYKL